MNSQGVYLSTGEYVNVIRWKVAEAYRYTLCVDECLKGTELDWDSVLKVLKYSDMMEEDQGQIMKLKGE